MARNMEYVRKVGVSTSETNHTWEDGKLKVTLTRKQESGKAVDNQVCIINKNGDTQTEGRSLWKGSPQQFSDFIESLNALHASVHEELHPTPIALPAPPCTCPITIAHDALCTK